MKGLLIKEFVSMKRYTRILLVLMVFYLVFTTAFMDDEGFIGSITAMFAIVIAVSSFSYDEAARWPELELYELLGVEFEGLDVSRRLFLPEDMLVTQGKGQIYVQPLSELRQKRVEIMEKEGSAQ